MASINQFLLLMICAIVMHMDVAMSQKVLPCSSSPCKSGGTCTNTPTTKTGYTCTCPKGTYGSTCTPCSRSCPKGQYQKVACNSTSDRVCANCTVCRKNQYQVSDCTATTDRVCKDCTNCTKTQYLVRDCTPTTDRVCKDCILDPYTGLCKGYGRCYFHGDSHYVTFDGTTPYTFHYQGICKYLVSKPKVASSPLPYFEVYARGEYRYGWSYYAWARYVEIVYGGHTIRLSRNTPLDGVVIVTDTPTSPAGSGYTYFLIPGFMRFVTWFGLIVDYDGYSEVRVYVPPGYSNDQLTGICGNFNWNVADDPTECNGYSYSGTPVNLFGDVCVVPDSDPDSCNCSYPSCPRTIAYASDTSSCEENPPPEYANQCEQLKIENGPFADCIGKLPASSDTTAQDLYDSCIMDACASNGAELCDSMRFMEKMCADLGIEIDTVALQRTTKCGPLDG